MDGISALPRPELRPYVRSYAQRRTRPEEDTIVQMCPTQLEQTLIFDFRAPLEVRFLGGRHFVVPDISVVGVQLGVNQYLHIPPDNQGFCVHFQPAGFSQLFGLPIRELTNQVHHGASVLGHQIRCLRDQMGEASFRERVGIIEKFLMQRLARVLTPNVVQSAAVHLLKHKGTVAMPDLARRYGVGLRQFERMYYEEVGLTPKWCARIARFESAMDLKIAYPQRPWLEIAHSLGYHDQMHLIHDFKKLAGDAPGSVMAQLGDIRPPALTTPERPVSDERSWTRMSYPARRAG